MAGSGYSVDSFEGHLVFATNSLMEVPVRDASCEVWLFVMRMVGVSFVKPYLLDPDQRMPGRDRLPLVTQC